MRRIAWVFVICTMTSTACSFDQSGRPTEGTAPADAADVHQEDAANVASSPDAGVAVVDAKPSKPDACNGKSCDD